MTAPTVPALWPRADDEVVSDEPSTSGAVAAVVVPGAKVAAPGAEVAAPGAEVAVPGAEVAVPTPAPFCRDAQAGGRTAPVRAKAPAPGFSGQKKSRRMLVGC